MNWDHIPFEVRQLIRPVKALHHQAVFDESQAHDSPSYESFVARAQLQEFAGAFAKHIEEKKLAHVERTHHGRMLRIDAFCFSFDELARLMTDAYNAGSQRRFMSVAT